MKKLFATLFIICTANSSYALAKDGFFVGGNINRSHSKHTIGVVTASDVENYETYRSFPENKTDKKAINFGLDAGYKYSYDNVFLAPEIFFDYLNNNAEDPYANDSDRSLYKQDVLTLNYRYGAKLNVGYVFAQKYNVFVNFGLANTDYQIDWNSNSTGSTRFHSYNGAKLSALYGVGFAYDLTKNLSLKATYDQQSYNIRYGLNGWRSKARLDVLKVGFDYHF